MSEDRFNHVCVGGRCDGLEFNLAVFKSCIRINYKNGYYQKSAVTNCFGQSVWNWHKSTETERQEK